MKKMQAYASFDDYVANLSSSHEEIVRALRELVRSVAPGLGETVKWGNGCWVDGGKPVAYVHVEPDFVQFGFFNGSSLKDPKGLLEGKGRYVRHAKVRASSKMDRRALAALLRQAITKARTPRRVVAKID